MTAPNQSNRDRYGWDARSTLATDMIETLQPEFAVIWLRRLDPNLHKYDWDATNFLVVILSVSQSQLETLKCVESKSENKTFWASQSYLCKFGSRRLSHITANSGSSVSIIPVAAVHLASHSYPSHFGHFDAVI